VSHGICSIASTPALINTSFTPFVNFCAEQTLPLRQIVVVQVYLAKWQETDVAVKVITQMQNLSPFQGLHPQDPATMELQSQRRRGTARRSMELVDEMTDNSKALQGEHPRIKKRASSLLCHNTWIDLAGNCAVDFFYDTHAGIGIACCLRLQLTHATCS